MHWKEMIVLALLLVLLTGLWFGTQSLAREQQLSREVVRLHVLAASDAPEDQAQKLAVRDAVLEELAELDADSPEEAVRCIENQLPKLANCAQQTLRGIGSGESVTVSLCRESYPTRDYGAFALPAGEYVSLQVRIGAAEGHNWWCVIYPNLCTAAEGIEWETAAAKLDGESLKLITADTRQVKIRFKFLEILQKVKKWF